MSGARPMLLYLAEAHANDSWPLSERAPQSHRDATQRLEAAQELFGRFPRFASLLEGHTYIDEPNNATALGNGLWPERYLLLEGARVRWASTLSFEERMANIPEQLVRAASAIWQ